MKVKTEPTVDYSRVYNCEHNAAKRNESYRNGHLSSMQLMRDYLITNQKTPLKKQIAWILMSAAKRNEDYRKGHLSSMQLMRDNLITNQNTPLKKQIA